MHQDTKWRKGHEQMRDTYGYVGNGLTVVGSTSISMRLTLVVYGIARLFNSCFQRSTNNSRNSWLKGPRYDKKPDASRTSPTSLHREWRRESPR